MLLLSSRQLIGILSDTLGRVDKRLINHGKHIAYIMFRVLAPQNRFDEVALRNICLAAFLHDIGAYKTEEIDKMLEFETINIWEHSIYGALFLKYFSPIKDLSPIIMFHHAECGEIPAMDSTYRMLAQLTSLADRADIFAAGGKTMQDFEKYLEKYRDIRYDGETIDIFLSSKINIETVSDKMETDEEFNRVFLDTPMSAEEVEGYVNMIVQAIDFRSNQTVIHTVAVACVACFLAKLFGANEIETAQVKTGAMLHDLGKITTPLHILESPNRLTEDEMKIMRLHIVASDEILSPHIGEPIKGIAVNHHEKLPGNGYPKGLTGEQITHFERIMIVADILGALCGSRSYKAAYPKERVVGILQKMSGDGLIDTEIVSKAVEHYDEIEAAANKEAAPVIAAYDAIIKEYRELLEKFGKTREQ